MSDFKWTGTAIAALVLLCGSGCGESQPAAQPPSYDEHMIAGGGTTGGPIDGLLVLWYFDEPSGQPIEGMRVMVGGDPSSALTATSDANGRVVFEDPSLSGPTDVHSLADGYPAGSMYGLNATYVTLERREIGYEPDPPTIEIGGTATGWENVPDPDDPQSQFKIAMVGYGLPLEDLLGGDYEFIEQADDPEWEMAVNMLALGLPQGDKDTWELEIYDRIGALTAIAGIYDTVAETYTTHAMALIPGFDPASGNLDEIEIDFSHPIVEENTIDVVVDPVPGEFELAGAQVMFDLAADGTVTFGERRGDRLGHRHRRPARGAGRPGLGRRGAVVRHARRHLVRRSPRGGRGRGRALGCDRVHATGRRRRAARFPGGLGLERAARRLPPVRGRRGDHRRRRARDGVRRPVVRHGRLDGEHARGRVARPPTARACACARGTSKSTTTG
jgi:hypothetical protein